MNLFSKFFPIVFLLFFSLFLSCLQAGQIRFAILRNDTPIGSYTFNLSGSESVRKLQAKMQIEVKILGIAAYKATHQRSETWENSKLQSLTGSSVYNGKKYDYKLTSTPQGPALKINGQTQALAPLYFTFLPWAFDISENTEVDFISEKGKIRHIRIQNAGQETLEVGKKKMSLTHIIYHDKNGDWKRNAWYDAKGQLQIMRYQQGSAQIQLIRETP